ncbi:MFS transporter [Janibacter cremeus]|uniref:MFS family permease n=1 Tax=Janibacter cremeus TaxID=1285192 RepID=A0A852VV78_9MICO|nr:MFS family permease [Janibacter cremeus]
MREAKGATHLSPEAARRVLLLLTLTRWLPIGLVVSLHVLWMLERGLTLTQALAASAVTGVCIFVLELPTSGIADALGRRPLLIVAGIVNILAALSFLLAHSLATFALAAALLGIFRALDSGPLEAWFVDTVHQSRPGADVDQDLSRMGTTMGLAMGTGAVASSALVAWHPIAGHSALWLPILVFVGLNVVHLVAVLLLLHEPARLDQRGFAAARASVAGAPGVVRSGLRLLRENRVLRYLVLVELFWSTSMVSFEALMPARMAELVGGEARAAVVIGPVAAVAWLVFALGAKASGWMSLRIGVARTAIVGRILTSLGAISMGLAFGPVALIATHLLTYSMHGFGGPVYNALLHREAHAGNRATVLSMASMVASAAFAAAGPLLGLLADHTSLQIGMAVAGVIGLGGAWCVLPALRAERERAAGRATPAPFAPGSR